MITSSCGRRCSRTVSHTNKSKPKATTILPVTFLCPTMTMTNKVLLQALFLAGTLLARIYAGFPTWTQDAPNTAALPLTKLNVAIDMVTSETFPDSLNEDIVLLSYERASALVNETTEEFPIALDTVACMVEQQGNASTTGPTVLVNGTRVMLVRTACNTTASARKLGISLAATIQSTASSDKAQTCSIDLTASNLTDVESWTELATSLWKGFYKDLRFQISKTSPPPCHAVTLVVHPDVVKVAQEGFKKGRILAEAVSLSRDVVNAPHNVLNSVSLAKTAEELARQYRTLSCRILGVADCEALGMGAFLGVARGSETTARFIHLTYRPRSRKARKNMKVLGIIGKGLLFDTGGKCAVCKRLVLLVSRLLVLMNAPLFII